MLLNFDSQLIDLYKLRRKELIKRIAAQYPGKEGQILLFAGFESSRFPFIQESSFFYYSGITEPAAVLSVDMSGKTVLFIPNCGEARAQWVYSPIALTQENAKELGVDEVRVLGDVCSGYTFTPFFEKSTYGHVIGLIEEIIKKGQAVFTLYPDDTSTYIEQRLILLHLSSFIKNLSNHLVDVSSIVTDMRLCKDEIEVEKIYHAVQMTCEAHEAAACSITDGETEAEVQATAEYIMTASNGTPAFPSIVATGKQATILHYRGAQHTLKNGELVLLDIGAQYHNYCADISRTYPVSGTFTKRQRELYDLVLQTQTYIAELAAPGYWLSNSDHPDKSLHHLAKAFLKQKGLDSFFCHSIGHYLGLDVHDVGNYAKPLEQGNVITIEPGIYIPQENIGIRIEDNYWIVKGGAVCLSDSLPRKAEDIEKLVQQTFDSHEDQGRYENPFDLDSSFGDIEH